MLNTYTKAVCFGVIAGMRSMSAPALISGFLVGTGSDELLGTPLEWFAQPITAAIFKMLAAGELLGDKLPSAPARTQPVSLVGRGGLGALSGGAVCVSEGEGMVEGAFIGAVAAVASTFAFYHLRRWLVEATPLPDSVVAIAEDVLVFGLGRQALSEE